MTETVIVSPNYVGILETLAAALAASQAALNRIAAAANVPTDDGKVTTITVQQIVDRLERANQADREDCSNDKRGCQGKA